MLRVTKCEGAGKITFKLEGKLAACWVDVMEQCWRQALAEDAQRPISVDLNAIAYVDSRGTELLLEMHRSGVELKAGTCMGKGIVEQIRFSNTEPAKNGH